MQLAYASQAPKPAANETLQEFVLRIASWYDDRPAPLTGIRPAQDGIPAGPWVDPKRTLRAQARGNAHMWDELTTALEANMTWVDLVDFAEKTSRVRSKLTPADLLVNFEAVAKGFDWQKSYTDVYGTPRTATQEYAQQLKRVLGRNPAQYRSDSIHLLFVSFKHLDASVKALVPAAASCELDVHATLDLIANVPRAALDAEKERDERMLSRLRNEFSTASARNAVSSSRPPTLTKPATNHAPDVPTTGFQPVQSQTPGTAEYFHKAKLSTEEAKAVNHMTFADTNEGKREYAAALRDFHAKNPNATMTPASISYPLTPGTVAAGTARACDTCGAVGHYSNACSGRRLPQAEINYRRAHRWAAVKPANSGRLNLMTESEADQVLPVLQRMAEQDESFGSGL